MLSLNSQIATAGRAAPLCLLSLHRVVMKPLAMLVQVMSQSAGVGACRMKLAERAMDETGRGSWRVGMLVLVPLA